MNNKNIEIELKFPLIDSGETIEKLNEVAESKTKDNYQKDDYYTPHHKNFIQEKPIKEWLRVRKAKNNSVLNYKNWHTHLGENSVSCDEYETKISDDKVLHKILKNLDFKHLITIEKTRSSWNYKSVEISIDNVSDLGNFIELEAKEDFSSIEEAKNHLNNVLKELNIRTGEQDFKGYPALMLEKKGLL